METKYLPTCEKHSGSENNTLCRECDRLLCFECVMEHYANHPDHKTITLMDLALSTIKLLENDKAKYGSCDALRQEFSSIESSLSEKVNAAKTCAAKLRSYVDIVLDNYIKSQLVLTDKLASGALELNRKIAATIQHAESATNNIALVKKLCSQRRFSELITLHEKASEPHAEPISLSAEKDTFAKEVEQLQVESFDTFEEKLKAQLSMVLEKFLFIHQGCSLCKKPVIGTDSTTKCAIHRLIICSECELTCSACGQRVCKGCMQNPCANNCGLATRCKNCTIRCSKCHLEVICEKCSLLCHTCKICEKCLSKYEKCELKLCENCHKNYSGKYKWYNGSDTYIRKQCNYEFISTNLPLPKAFKAEIQIMGCDKNYWSIGISGNQFNGTDEFTSGERNNYLIGGASGLIWNEYGWAACLHSHKCINGIQASYGKPVTNGKIALILDKTRTLKGEINGVPQGVIESGIPDGNYYLSFSGDSNSGGQLKILSIEELK